MRACLSALSIGGALLLPPWSMAADPPSAPPPAPLNQKKPFEDQNLEERLETAKSLIPGLLKQYGAAYHIELEIVDMWKAMKYEVVADAFTTVVRDEMARPAAFKIHITDHYLKKISKDELEHLLGHELSHVVNDDLTGYHRHRESETAAERRVYQVVGPTRYKGFLDEYARHHHWPSEKRDRVFERVEDFRLLPPPNETDQADEQAAAYFRRVRDGKEHLLIYNGRINDITGASSARNVNPDPEKLLAIIREGKPIVFFHKHLPNELQASFPSGDDYGSAALFQYLVEREHPGLKVEFRVMSGDEQTASVSYGFKKAMLGEIQNNAHAYRDMKERFAKMTKSDSSDAQLKVALDEIDRTQTKLNFHVARDSFWTYLKNAAPVDLEKPGEFTTRPENFIWPSDKYSLRYLGTIKQK